MVDFGVLRPVTHFLIPLFVHWVAEEMTKPVITDVAAGALCPDSDSCPEAIYLNGLQQTVVGIFRVLVDPVLGQFADDYGRKPLLLLGMSASILPYAVLAWNQSKQFLYVYFVFSTLSSIISKGTVLVFALTYAADLVDGPKRTAAFGQITGIISASKVVGGVLALLLPKIWTYKVSVLLLISSSIYLNISMVEEFKRPVKVKERGCLGIMKERWESMRDSAMLVRCNETLRRILYVCFFYNLGMSGISSVLTYYQKSIFSFDKGQFSNLQMLIGIVSIVSQVFLLPLLHPFLKEEGILCISVLAATLYAFLYGVAWASWVPYLSSSLGFLYELKSPSSRVIVSKASFSSDQGKAQGLVEGVISLSSMLSPLVISPVTSLFLSNEAPFDCKGFGILLATLPLLAALGHSLMLMRERRRRKSSNPVNNDFHLEENTTATVPLLTSLNAVVDV